MVSASVGVARSLVVGAFAVTVSGCYASHLVAPSTLTSVGAQLSSNATLESRAGKLAPLRPSTGVRVHRVDGTSSGWCDGGDLSVLADGLAQGRPRALAEAREAFVADLGEAELAGLRAVGPLGGLAEAGGRRRSSVTFMIDAATARDYESLLDNPLWTHLTAPSSSALVTWIGRFLAEAPPEEPGGEKLWLFVDAGHRRLAPPLSSAELARNAPERNLVWLVPGTRWADAEAVELRSVDALPTLAAAVPVVPLVVLAALAASSAGVDGEATSETAERPAGGLDRGFATIVPPTPPLFEADARRRGYVRPLALAAAFVDHRGGRRADLLVGLRLYDLYELGFVLRGQRNAAGRGGGSEGDLGFSLGVLAPFDEISPWTVTFALAGGAGLATPHLFWMEASPSLRRSLTRSLFAALPFSATFREGAPHTGVGTWSLGAGLALGGAW
jgi:hypothetical protein